MLAYLLEKEFKQLLRNKFIPRLTVFMPLAVLGLFPLVANFDVKDVSLAVVDNDHSPYSRRLVEKVRSSGYFIVETAVPTYDMALESVEKLEADVVLVIPAHFEHNLMTGRQTGLVVAANSVNGMRGGLSSSHLMGVVGDFGTEIASEQKPEGLRPGVDIVPRYHFNPRLSYTYTMVPAILMMVLAMLTGFLPALNIVSEREHGTIEQMNVTPVSRPALILSKLIPYWVLGFVVLTICFFVAWLFYGMVSIGGYLPIYGFAALFGLAFSGFGLMISNYASSVQQGMFIMFFFVITYIFTSGLYTPVSSMPDWLQKVSLLSPLRYMVEALRAIFLKGSSLADLGGHLGALAAFAVVFNGWAILSYRKSRG
jgi:ABC-2 type transport system permease protein